MGNRLNIFNAFFILIVLILNTGCISELFGNKSADSFIQTDIIIVDNYELKLGEDKKTGYLVYKKIRDNNTPEIDNKEQRVALKIAPPCYFYRFPNGKPRYYSYRDVGVNAVLFIIGSPELDIIATNKGQDIYKQRVHGILIYEDGSIAFSEEIMKKLCVDVHAGIDEKDFYAFAHYYNPKIKSETSGPDN